MEESLDLESILGTDQIENLFAEDTTQESPPEELDKEDKNKKEETTEVDVELLFDEEPESVGGEDKENNGKEDTDSNKGGSSPKNFYSSIAKALKEEGIFPDLEENSLESIKTPEDFAAIIENLILSKLDEKLKRIDAALSTDVELSVIKNYENTLSYLDNIKEDSITDETELGETLRKLLIYQDFINRGYSKERAQREVNKSITSGSDIEDAKEALVSNKDFFNLEYDKLIKEARLQLETEEKQRLALALILKKSILEDKNFFEELHLEKSIRQKIYDNISKPVFKDPNSGEFLTAIQKYEMDNKTDFMKNIGLLFTLTDGFKNLDSLVKGKVKREVGKGLRELENTINNTLRSSDGNLKFISGVDEDPESFITKGWNIDV